MEILQKFESGVSRGIAFVIHLFSATQSVAALIGKVGPSTLAALLALFYDVMTSLISGGEAAEKLATGDFQDAITLSATTKTLLLKVAADFKAGETLIIADFKALGIAVKTAGNAAA